MNRSGRLVTKGIVAMLFCTAAANAVTISILRGPVVTGPNLNVTTSSSRITLTDFFDQHSETDWAIQSAVENGDGGVDVTYDFGPFGAYDSYTAFGDLSFEILSDSGSTTPEAVTLDVFGNSVYQHQVNLGCCFPVPPSVFIEGGGTRPYEYEPPNNGTFDTIDGTVSLFTNTRYFLGYSNTQYVEGVPQTSYMPTSFSSLAAYNSWVGVNGTSGTISVDSVGHFNYSLAVRPSSVPEPGTLSLLGLALVGVAFARRRSHAQARA